MIASVIRYCQVERWKRESSQFEDMHPKSERESIPFHFYGAKTTFNHCWRSLFTLSVAAAVWLVRFTPHSKLLRLPKTNSGKQCLLVIMPPWQFASLTSPRYHINTTRASLSLLFFFTLQPTKVSQDDEEKKKLFFSRTQPAPLVECKKALLCPPNYHPSALGSVSLSLSCYTSLRVDPCCCLALVA